MSDRRDFNREPGCGGWIAACIAFWIIALIVVWMFWHG